MPVAFPVIEIHRYRGTHDTCRLLLRANGDRPTVTAIPQWESDEQALERAWRDRGGSAGDAGSVT
jgi:hypothetical protein